ncbi:MAG: aminodeoxychorismate/anthranilate synthase component II [Proteobacteria bacterium]|nr:aminodeoxychorismate/anthranilate synthase component II [Pseudomonadota bacterium]
MILLIDALDSFTYNLVQAFQALGEDVEVARFDQISLDDVRKRNPDLIVLSPGPGHPTECKIHVDIAASDLAIPVFGVCLGQQALAAGSGGRVTHAREPLHGEATPVEHHGTGVFENLPQPLMVGRYHSLIVDDATLPQEWEITARSASGEPMAMAHRVLPRWGVQFHPESILTPDGPALLANVLRLSGLRS